MDRHPAPGTKPASSNVKAKPRKSDGDARYSDTFAAAPPPIGDTLQVDAQPSIRTEVVLTGTPVPVPESASATPPLMIRIKKPQAAPVEETHEPDGDGGLKLGS